MRTIDKRQTAAETGLNFIVSPSLSVGLGQAALTTGNPLFALGQAGVLGSNIAGGILGSVADVPTKKDIDRWNKSALPGLIPGVANYRATQRALYDQRKRKHIKANLLSEDIGVAIPFILGSGAGAMLGSEYFGKGSSNKFDYGLMGSVAGAVLGGVVPAIVGAALARIHRRTKKQQNEHDDKINLINYFVPGAAWYNAAQRALNS